MLIETFLARRLDLAPEVRASTAKRIAEHITQKLELPAQAQPDNEDFLEAVAREYRIRCATGNFADRRRTARCPNTKAAFFRCYDDPAGWSSLVARWAHNPKVGGSNPPPATAATRLKRCGRSTFQPLRSSARIPTRTQLGHKIQERDAVFASTKYASPANHGGAS